MRWLVSFVVWALVASTTCISAASAQEPGRVYRIGFLELGAANWGQIPPKEKWTNSRGVAFREGLRDNGFVLGKNLIAEVRHASGDVGRLAAEVEALVAANVDVIVTPGSPPTIAAIKATRPVPVVFVRVGDPVEQGIVASLARPGGNATGMAVLITQGKLWEYVREISPATRRLAIVNTEQHQRALLSDDRQAAYVAFAHKRSMEHAAAVGFEVVNVVLNTLDDAGPKFAEFAADGNGALYLVPSSTMQAWRPTIMSMALKNRLVTGCLQDRQWAEAGCLVTYTEDGEAIFRSAAGMVAKVLRGTKPADIPVQEPTSFKLVINTKTAKALDLTVPHHLLTTADELIE